MEKDKLLKNVPLEMLGELKKLSSRLWAENNPVAVQLSVIIEEFEAESSELENLFANYEKHYADKAALIERRRAAETVELQGEVTALKEQVRGLEAGALAGASTVKALKAALEKSESEAASRYSKEEINLLEQQILELKKELPEFRQLKEIDDRKILELEAMVATKAEEVERRFINRTQLLEKENSELKTQAAELEKAKLEDDARIKELRSALEKSERGSREKYTKLEVDLLEQQILEFKKELGEFRQLKEIDDRKILDLEAMVATKAEEVERRFINRTRLLEKENSELKAQAAELEKAKAEDDARIKEFRSALEKSERESREKYTRPEVDLLEQQILELKKELGEFRQLKDLDERKISELSALLDGRAGDVEKKYVGRVMLLEKTVSELQGELVGLEEANSKNSAKASELKKLVAAKDSENADLKARLADAEMEANARLTMLLAEKNRELAEVKGSYLAGQFRQSEKLGKMEEETLRKLEERKKELESDYQARAEVFKTRERELEAEYNEKTRRIAARERAIEGDFAASKTELIRTFDKIRLELERRESALDEREGKLKPPQEPSQHKTQ